MIKGSELNGSNHCRNSISSAFNFMEIYGATYKSINKFSKSVHVIIPQTTLFDLGELLT